MSIESYQQQEARQKGLLPVVIIAILVLFIAIGTSSNARAGDREQAKRIHDRLVGTPPGAACLDQLQTKVTAGNANDAASMAVLQLEGRFKRIGAGRVHHPLRQVTA